MVTFTGVQIILAALLRRRIELVILPSSLVLTVVASAFNIPFISNQNSAYPAPADASGISSSINTHEVTLSHP
jgi:hypothetical protein